MIDSEFAIDDIQVLNTALIHGQGIFDTVRLAYGYPLDHHSEQWIHPEAVS